MDVLISNKTFFVYFAPLLLREPCNRVRSSSIFGTDQMSGVCEIIGRQTFDPPP